MAEWIDGSQYNIQQRLIKVVKFWLGKKEEVPGLAKPLKPLSCPKLPTGGGTTLRPAKWRKPNATHRATTSQ